MDLQKLNDDLLKETKALTSSKQRLERVKQIVENKNKELEHTPEDFYALRLAMEQTKKEKRLKEENQEIKRRLDE